MKCAADLYKRFRVLRYLVWVISQEASELACSRESNPSPPEETREKSGFLCDKPQRLVLMTCLPARQGSSVLSPRR